MDKTKGDVILRYLLLCGAIKDNFILFNKKEYSIKFYTHELNFHKIENKKDQDNIINKINNFDGICYIYSNIDRQEHLDTTVFITHLLISWDNSKEAKRIRRLRKIKQSISSY